MAAIITVLTVLALTVYGLERNHHRRIALGSRLAGSADAEDRDVPRVVADLRAAAARPARDRAGSRHAAPSLRSTRPIRSA
ncbi:hypothetical protein ACIGNX_20455 [Actinosynnema sp. NPDC053489]|uniref:hypothetical protein n=1 Tax=Actinosynnema sp. NPDC053489 TaxID=3363916 RepID=UPI0037C9C512